MATFNVFRNVLLLRAFSLSACTTFDIPRAQGEGKHKRQNTSFRQYTPTTLQVFLPCTMCSRIGTSPTLLAGLGICRCLFQGESDMLHCAWASPCEVLGPISERLLLRLFFVVVLIRSEQAYSFLESAHLWCVLKAYPCMSSSALRWCPWKCPPTCSSDTASLPWLQPSCSPAMARIAQLMIFNDCSFEKQTQRSIGLLLYYRNTVQLRTIRLDT